MQLWIYQSCTFINVQLIIQGWKGKKKKKRHVTPPILPGEKLRPEARAHEWCYSWCIGTVLESFPTPWIPEQGQDSQTSRAVWHGDCQMTPVTSGETTAAGGILWAHFHRDVTCPGSLNNSTNHLRVRAQQKKQTRGTWGFFCSFSELGLWLTNHWVL